MEKQRLHTSIEENNKGRIKLIICLHQHNIQLCNDVFLLMLGWCWLVSVCAKSPTPRAILTSTMYSKGSFVRKLNFVTDSNQYCIHRKRTWNCTSKVFNWWYLMTRSDCQVGMLSRRCKTHICDINTAFFERDVNASEEGDMEQYYRILENEQNQINSTNVDIENVGAGNRNTNNNASTTIANCNSPTQSFVEDIPTETENQQTRFFGAGNFTSVLCKATWCGDR